MFRISFDPKIGMFVIEVVAFFGLVWRRVLSEGDWRMFTTYAEACDYVKAIGLDKLYENKSADRYREYIDPNRQVRVI